MKLHITRLRNVLDSRSDDVKKENDLFLQEINDALASEDVELVDEGGETFAPIFLIETGGTENQFVKYIDSITHKTIILICNQRNNSRPASLEIASFCRQNGFMCWVLSTPETMPGAFRQIADVEKAIESLKDNNLGVIGKPSDWLIASVPDYDLVKKECGFNLIDISMEEFFNEIESVDDSLIELTPHYKDFLKKANKDTLDFACKVYHAIKVLVNRYHLHGLTIRCFDMLGKYKNTACLALGLLNEEGITSACEGDICALISMHILATLSGKPVFMANPSYVDFNKEEMLLAHCTVPFNMVSSYELPTHFESNLGIGIEGKLNNGFVTLFKIFIHKEKNEPTTLDFVTVEGEIIESMNLPGYCRTQIKVKCDANDFRNINSTACGNHLLICYGEYEENLNYLMSAIDFNSK